MKIKNTPEAKARFFALYWGARCLRNVLVNDRIPPLKVEVFKANEYEYLELTPLSQISDEDAIEWYLNTLPDCYHNHRADEWKHTTEIDRHDNERWIVSAHKGQLISKHKVTATDLSFKQAKYLIERGYYVGDGTEIEYGWVKLKETK